MSRYGVFVVGDVVLRRVISFSVCVESVGVLCRRRRVVVALRIGCLIAGGHVFLNMSLAIFIL